MRRVNLLLIVLVLLFLGGCATAPQPEVRLSSQYWESSSKTVGLFVAPIGEPQLYMEGDVRLLDYAINAAVMSPVTGHFGKLDLSDFEALRDEIAAHFRDQGVQVVLVDEIQRDGLSDFADPNKEDADYFARKDYTKLADKYGIDQLLLIETQRVGVARPYQGFLPMGEPRAVFELQGQLIDMRDNRLLWYADVQHQQFASGSWDEPPAYPGLTNGFYAALEAAKQHVREHLQHNVEPKAQLDTAAAEKAL